MSAFSSAFSGPAMYPTTQPVPNNQQVVIPQITIPQALSSYVPQAQPSIQPQIQRDIPLRVKGMDGAKAFQTRANGMYALFDEDDDVFYMKVTDQNNYPIALKRYRFFEEEEPQPPDPPQYVTMEEFEKFKEEMLNAKQSVRTQSKSVKSDDESDKQSTAK